MKLWEYGKRMLFLSVILTVLVNLLLIGLRLFPLEIFTQWVWRLDLGNTVLIIPWFAMVVLSVVLTLLQYFFHGRKKK